jgi:hypothetical protein
MIGSNRDHSSRLHTPLRSMGGIPLAISAPQQQKITSLSTAPRLSPTLHRTRCQCLTQTACRRAVSDLRGSFPRSIPAPTRVDREFSASRPMSGTVLWGTFIPNPGNAERVGHRPPPDGSRVSQINMTSRFRSVRRLPSRRWRPSTHGERRVAPRDAPICQMMHRCPFRVAVSIEPTALHRAIEDPKWPHGLGQGDVRQSRGHVGLARTPPSSDRIDARGRSFPSRSSVLFLRILSNHAQLHPANQRRPLGFGRPHRGQSLL